MAPTSGPAEHEAIFNSPTHSIARSVVVFLGFCWIVLIGLAGKRDVVIFALFLPFLFALPFLSANRVVPTRIAIRSQRLELKAGRFERTIPLRSLRAARYQGGRTPVLLLVLDDGQELELRVHERDRECVDVFAADLLRAAEDARERHGSGSAEIPAELKARQALRSRQLE